MKNTSTNRSLGFSITRCKSLANTDIIYCGFSGGQYWSVDNNGKNRKALSKWLRETAKMIESWK